MTEFTAAARPVVTQFADPAAATPPAAQEGDHTRLRFTVGLTPTSASYIKC
jgi:hypothetical protein